MTKRNVVVFIIVVIAIISLAPQGIAPVPAVAQGIGAVKPIVTQSEKNDQSPPLRSIQAIELRADSSRTIPLHRLNRKPFAASSQSQSTDPVVQKQSPAAPMPSPIQNFDGIFNPVTVFPPDTNGDIGYDPATGKRYYVQWVNLSFAIWDVTGTPTMIYGPVAGNTLWSGFGAPCATTNDGDPIVLFDSINSRWFMSQLALPNCGNTCNGPFYQCIAVSKTADPTGVFNRYVFKISDTKLNDYPKFGVWNDAYYMSINQFNMPSSTWGGAGSVAFERSKMLTGDSARMIYFDLYSVDPNLGGMLPSDFDGTNLPAPPAGAPNYFVQFDDNAWGYSPDQLQVWQFHVDWNNTANSTFGNKAVLATASFDSNLCNYNSNCIPQPGTFAGLDALSDRLMNRLAYRLFYNHESLVVNHTVNAGSGRAGIRWYELSKSFSGTWGINQQGTYAPADTEHRWMGSIAMDAGGNIALGYSVSSATVKPSIRYVGRLASDPLNTLPQTEVTLITGTGVQTDSQYFRWGDYTMMAIDPFDDCTFWYTNEYYQTNGNRNWRTRIGSFKFPSCAPMIAPYRYFYPFFPLAN